MCKSHYGTLAQGKYMLVLECWYINISIVAIPLVLHIRYKYRGFILLLDVPALAKGPIRYFCIFHDRVLGFEAALSKAWELGRGRYPCSGPTRGSRFSRYRVIVKSPVVLLRRTRSLVPHARQLIVPILFINWCPRVCTLLVVCCIHIIRLLSLAWCFVSSGLKNMGWSHRV